MAIVIVAISLLRSIFTAVIFRQYSLLLQHRFYYIIIIILLYYLFAIVVVINEAASSLAFSNFSLLPTASAVSIAVTNW